MSWQNALLETSENRVEGEKTGWRCGGSIGSAPDFWGRGSGFESGVSHNDPGALQDHCVIL